MPHRQPNSQPREGYARDSGAVFDVHSVFLTIQGEGPFTGHRAVFVRLAGCNLQCPGCDTEYTHGRRTVGRKELVDEILAARSGARTARMRHHELYPLVVITGGEPLRQRIGSLVRDLTDAGLVVQIESNGMFPPDPVLGGMLRSREYSEKLHLIVSPKTPKVAPECAEAAAAFKYVIDSRFVQADGLPLFALENAVVAKGKMLQVARPPAGKPVYLTPYDSGDPERDAANRAAVAASCLRNGFIAGLQVHKLFDIP